MTTTSACPHCYGDHDGCTGAAPLCAAGQDARYGPSEPRFHCRRHDVMHDDVCAQCENDDMERTELAYFYSTESQNDYGRDG